MGRGYRLLLLVFFLAGVSRPIHAQSPPTIEDRLKEIEKLRQIEIREVGARVEARSAEEARQRAEQIAAKKRKRWGNRLLISALLPGAGQAWIHDDANWLLLTTGYLVSGIWAISATAGANAKYDNYRKSTNATEARFGWEEAESSQKTAVIMSYTATTLWGISFIHALAWPISAAATTNVSLRPDGLWIVRRF